MVSEEQNRKIEIIEDRRNNKKRKEQNRTQNKIE